MKKTIIISGADGNLGKALAEKFLKEGHHVESLVHHAPEENQVNDSLHYEVMDLLNEEKVNAYVEKLVKDNRSIDAAILTAGGFAAGDLSATSIKDIQQQIRLNFETAYNIARPVFLQMKKQQSGIIFFIGSQPGLHPEKGADKIAYTLSKSMLFSLAKTLNAEGKDVNVRAGILAPNIIDTPQNREAMPDADFSTWASPKKVAEILYFHCTEPADLIAEAVIRLR